MSESELPHPLPLPQLPRQRRLTHLHTTLGPDLHRNLARCLHEIVARKRSMSFFRYVKRRAQEGFHQHAGESEAAAVTKLWEKAQSDLDLVRRQATVYTLFARKHKSIMVRACARRHPNMKAPHVSSELCSLAFKCICKCLVTGTDQRALHLQDMPLQRVKDTV